MPTFQSKNGPIYFEQRGSRAAVPIVLIHGLGCQTVHWPESFLSNLERAGYRIVTLDNRDTGFSFGVEQEPPDLLTLLAALDDPTALTPTYQLIDMADDIVQLLDHIGQSGAHIVGMSMGGMIAQRLAVQYPARVFSLSLLMSSTGNPQVPKPEPEVIGALASTIMTRDREENIECSKKANQIFGGIHYDSCEHGIGRFVEVAHDRAHRPEGVSRQLSAILSDGDRRPLLADVKIPSLILHGEEDPLVHQNGSRDLAKVLPNAKLVLLKDMGHDLPEPLIPEIVNEILAHIGNVEVSR